MVDAKKEIRRAVDTGQVSFGLRQAEKDLLSGSVQMVIITKNMPQLSREKIENQAKIAAVPLYVFEGSGHELGSVCGKPFVVSAMLVKDAGQSKIAEILKASKTKKTAKKKK